MLINDLILERELKNYFLHSARFSFPLNILGNRVLN